MTKRKTIYNEYSMQNMQDHQKQSKGGHEEIQPRDHMRNDLGTNEPEENPKNAEARPRQTDHTP